MFLAILLSPGWGIALASTSERDLVFFFSSDPHIGYESKDPNKPVTGDQAVAEVRDTLSQMRAVVGQPYPPLEALRSAATGTVARPRGILVAGDLTDNGEWPLFETVFPAGGLENGSIPLFLCVGNHDGPPDGPTRQGVISRNRRMLQDRLLDGVSPNGLHTTRTWDGVRFICVNLCPADTTDAQTPFNYGHPGPGTWNDPEGGLTFLTGVLKDRVGASGDPVILMQHYGFCEGFNFDWNWWSVRQRRDFYDAIKGYNVVALLHGHTHAPACYRWPDPVGGAREVQRLFGDTPPADLRSFDVFSAGSFGGGTFYVFRMLGDRILAAHHDRRGWTADPRMHRLRIKEEAEVGQAEQGSPTPF